MKYFIAALVVFGGTLFYFLMPKSADSTLDKLSLQSEARTCREALVSVENPAPEVLVIYCQDIIDRYTVMAKAYNKEQHQRLIERARKAVAID